MEKPNADTMTEADLKEIASRSIDTILQEGTDFQEGIDFNVIVDKPNILHKVGLKKRKRKLVINPIYMGSLERISKIILAMEFHGLDVISKKPEEINALELLHAGIENMAAKQNINNIVKIAAIAIVNKDPKHPNPLIRLYIRNKEKNLVGFLKWNLLPAEAYKLYTAVIQKMDMQSFLGLMVSIRGMSLMETENSRTNGDLSKDSSNISDSPETKSSGDTPGQT